MSHRFTDAEKTAALRELENAHFEAGLWDGPEDGPYEACARRAFEASNRMREVLGLSPRHLPAPLVPAP
jgi:hypothetical protein